jgi:hypothetical protein
MLITHALAFRILLQGQRESSHDRRDRRPLAA